MSRDFLPRQDVQLVDSAGRTSNPFYVWMQSLDAMLKGGATVTDIEAALAELRAALDNIPTSGFLPDSTNIFGQNSVVTFGTLANGVVMVQLLNDTPSPYPWQFYGVGTERVAGWRWMYDALEAGTGLVKTMDGFNVLGVLDAADELPVSADVGDAYLIAGNLWAWDGSDWIDEGDASGVTMFALAPLPDTGEGALLAITRDQYGRVEGTKPATITGTPGQIEVADGDAVAGLPTISLADLADAGGGAIRKFDRDAKGRVSGTSAATTDDLAEGTTNLYHTAARVRDTLLTGLSLASAAAVTAANTILEAIGQLQAQINSAAATLANAVLLTGNQIVGGVKTFTGNPRVNNGAPQFYFEEADTGKIWVYLLNNSGFSLNEDSTSGANARLRIEPGAERLNLAPAGAMTYGSNTVWHSGNVSLASGTYTPTATGTANVASATGGLCTYARNGNTVILSGRIDVTPTAASTFTTTSITLPPGIASNFTAGTQASGVALWNTGSTAMGSGLVNSGAGANALSVQFISSSTGVHTIRFTIAFPILP